MWSNVQEFRDWWCETRPIRPPFSDASFVTDCTYSLCLFREGQFQVELYISKPNTQAPFHSHPGVDSAFVYLAGNLDFGSSDKTFMDLSEYQKEGANGAHMLLGKTAEALDGSVHTLRVHKEGAAFLSFEHWKEKKPDSVILNWMGEPDGTTHERLLAA